MAVARVRAPGSAAGAPRARGRPPALGTALSTASASGAAGERGRASAADAVDAAARESFAALARVFAELPAAPLDVEGYWAGSWTGREIGEHAGCMAGSLGACGWRGKAFYADSTADALVFDRDGAGVAMRPPSRLLFRAACAMPARLRAERFAPSRWLARAAMRPARERSADLVPLALAGRGARTMAMAYRELDVTDVFKRVDDATVMGAMVLGRHAALEGAAAPREPVFFFLLSRGGGPCVSS